ncbi:MAG: hypothetical protein IT376_04565 [Polyangiaceae bacterium]|nr:hypothetical protein [Polyangiaceae bacterium]
MTTDDLDLEPPPAGVPVALAPGPARAPAPSAWRAFLLATSVPRPWLVWSIAGALTALPILGWLVVYGWLGEAHRRLAQHDPQPLPPLRLIDLPVHARSGLAPLLAGHGGALALGATLLAFAITLLPALAFVLALGEGPLGALALIAGAGLASGALAVSAALATAALTHVELHRDEPLALPALLRAARRTWWPLLRVAPGFAVIAVACVALGALACGVGVVPALGCVQLAALHLRSQLREAAAAHPHEDVPPRSLLPSELRAAAPTAPRVRVPRPPARGGPS